MLPAAIPAGSIFIQPCLRGADVLRRASGGLPALLIAIWALASGALVFGPLTSGALAQGLPPGDAKALGLAPEKLERISQLLQESVAARQIAGASASIIRKGQVAYLATIGLQDVEAKTPLAAGTIFRIASMTKPVTSVAAMMLVDEGKLRVSDPVSKYIPEFKSLTVLVPKPGDGKETPPYTLVPAEREITVHHLLTHTSGISYGLWGRPGLGELYIKAGVSDGLIETPGTMADNVRRLALAPLLHQPGSAWGVRPQYRCAGRAWVEVGLGPVARWNSSASGFSAR
jgi:CubicO group peptidase (beta-lactamase class C family)